MYKGWLLLRGDITQTDRGHYVVFSEQGARSSSMSATKLSDGIAHLDGCDSSDSDAIGAYTQVKLADAAELLGPGVVPMT